MLILVFFFLLETLTFDKFLLEVLKQRSVLISDLDFASKM